MGRRSYQQLFELTIQSVLDREIPRNVENIRRMVSDKIGRRVSWNTVKKYLENLRDQGRVEEIHSGKILLYKLR